MGGHMAVVANDGSKAYQILASGTNAVNTGLSFYWERTIESWPPWVMSETCPQKG